jgi:hypothetical protein
MQLVGRNEQTLSLPEQRKRAGADFVLCNIFHGDRATEVPEAKAFARSGLRVGEKSTLVLLVTDRRRRSLFLFLSTRCLADELT